MKLLSSSSHGVSWRFIFIEPKKVAALTVSSGPPCPIWDVRISLRAPSPQDRGTGEGVGGEDNLPLCELTAPNESCFQRGVWTLTLYLTYLLL